MLHSIAASWFVITSAVDTLLDANEVVSLLQRRVSPQNHVGVSDRPTFAQHKIAFLGDTIMAGMADLCKGSDAPVAFPTLSCEMLRADCNVFAEAGIGMHRSRGRARVRTAPLLWQQQTIGLWEQRSDEHLSPWIPDAIVVNVGVNDNVSNVNSPCRAEFREAYEDWLLRTNIQYNSHPTFFLACGPTHVDYCQDVHAVVEKGQATGIKTVFVDMLDENVARATECMHHPGAGGHAYLAHRLTAVIRKEMAWS